MNKITVNIMCFCFGLAIGAICQFSMMKMNSLNETNQSDNVQQQSIMTNTYDRGQFQLDWFKESDFIWEHWKGLKY